MEQGKKLKNESLIILISVIAVFVLFAVILIIPASRDVFTSLSSEHPYIMGFIKFALLATAGELIAIKMSSGDFKRPPYLIARLIIWGIIGIWITYMMKIFFLGTGILMSLSLLPSSDNNFIDTFLNAFYTSATMNTTFGPTFMAVHKCSDMYLSLKYETKDKVSLGNVIGAVDWHKFVSFTLFKTVPIFWIPAHTLTFMLPSEYQVLLAALLSVALGVILNFKKSTKK